MKLFGSLNNRLMENSKPPAPTVGMGATVLMYSDRHAASVVQVISPKKIVIQYDKATRADKNGMSDSQTYTYAPNPDGAKATATLRKDGRWKIEREGTVILLGHRSEHYDYGF